MLSKFSVKNFKNFDSEIQLNLENSSKYEFNSSSIKDGIVNNAIVYGLNGSGKSNLGLAIFDIVQHLTEFQKNEQLYLNYTNANNKELLAEFKYNFTFGKDKVEYAYSKSTSKQALAEHLKINGKLVASIDRYKSPKASIYLKGAESLNNEITNPDLSLIRYIKNNSLLKSTHENWIFHDFYVFVESMLFFRNVDQNMYIGLENGNLNIQEDLIKRGKVKDLEKFLNAGGINGKLKVASFGNNEIIFFDFGKKTIPFYEIASTGTKSLTLFFSWLQRIKQDGRVKFIFMDEFDAFYHHTLSKLIVNELKNTGVQFILTTHNTSIVSNEILRPDCYFRIENGKIKSFSNLTSKELREAHNIEKMYKAGAFNE